jgi:2-keto-4-pentenoate hydratase/2-oxohepta-3-ene-1,7-dioic acid hydratase in catechol pathway
MRLCTFLDAGTPRVGRVEGERVIPLAAPDLVTLIRGGDAGEAGPPVPLSRVSLTAPLRPVKLLGVVRNYALHAAEMREEAHAEPQLFSKLVTAVTGPDGPVMHPARITSELDYEGELAVVIGRAADHVPEARAMEHVFGYTIINDVSARDLQRSERQWTRAKGCRTFAPMGPWVVTADEIPDPHALRIRTWVNGELRQDGSTGDMLHRIPKLISRFSECLTFEPGDVIATGTPAGVGKGFDPPRFLTPGDTVRIEIDPIGAIEHEVRPGG